MKKLQEKYLEFQILQQQIEEISKNVVLLREEVNKLRLARKNLEDLEEVEVGSEILAPVTGGIFVKGELKDNKKLLVNVGASMVVRKSIPEARELLNKQIKQVERQQMELDTGLESLGMKAEMVYKAIEELSKKKEK